MNKQCIKCLQDLPTTEFTPNVKTKDGFQHQCKSCANHKRKTKIPDSTDQILEQLNNESQELINALNDLMKYKNPPKSKPFYNTVTATVQNFKTQYDHYPNKIFVSTLYFSNICQELQTTNPDELIAYGSPIILNKNLADNIIELKD